MAILTTLMTGPLPKYLLPRAGYSPACPKRRRAH
jgi:hypothetical protein